MSATSGSQALPAFDPQLEREVVRFLHHEALLLDEGRFEAWLDLFAEDGRYWVPAEPDQESPLTHVSIMYEDKTVLRMRVRRLLHPRAYAHTPHPRTTHVVGNIDVVETVGTEIVARSTLIVFALREELRATYSGRVRHRLRREGQGLQIVEKRVDLIDSNAIHHHVITVPF
jgi:3-phenylpropionate/cinnamic acid dioxygenase small subunit